MEKPQAERPNYIEERRLDEATLLEKAHLSSKEARLLEICKELAITERLLYAD